MADSHKHLSISDEEWSSFIEGLHDVSATDKNCKSFCISFAER
jgi:hypothetical protein